MVGYTVKIISCRKKDITILCKGNIVPCCHQFCLAFLHMIDNQEQCCSHNIVASCFQLPGTIYNFWPCMVRYGMVWYGMVWYGMVWYGMV